MEIRYNDIIYEESESMFLKRLVYRDLFGKDTNNHRDYSKIPMFGKIKFKFRMYKKLKTTDRPILFRHIIRDVQFVRSMYNSNLLDINDCDGFGWYSEYFGNQKIIP